MIHYVNPGEGYYAIANFYNVDVSLLRHANADRPLWAGQPILVPLPRIVAPEPEPPVVEPEPEWPPDPIPDPDPPIVGWPDISNTGPTRWDLLQPSGSIDANVDGMVIENLDIVGNVNVNASNVTIRNCKITSVGAKYLINIDSDGGHSGTLIEDCELDGQNKSTQGVVHAGYTIRRCNIHHTEDGLRASGDVLVEDCWIHDLSVGGTTWSASPHNDGIQSIGGDNIVVRHNRIEGPYREQTSAIIFHAHLVGPLTNVLIEDNILSGGTYTLNLKARGENPDLGADVVVRNNVIVKDAWKYGPLNTDRAGGVVYDGNTLSDGAPFPS